jgi:hypothetical protein
MQRLLLGVVCLGIVGCSNQPPSQVTTDIQYLYDLRTNLCFASRYGGLGANSFAMTAVTCSPAVIALAQERRP